MRKNFTSSVIFVEDMIHYHHEGHEDNEGIEKQAYIFSSCPPCSSW